MYNIVWIDWEDTTASRMVRVGVQFSYDAVRGLEYQVGDELEWGFSEIGIRDAAHVVAEGVSDGPEREGVPEDWEVHISANHITRVVPSTGRFRLNEIPDMFVILDGPSRPH